MTWFWESGPHSFAGGISTPSRETCQHLFRHSPEYHQQESSKFAHCFSESCKTLNSGQVFHPSCSEMVVEDFCGQQCGHAILHWAFWFAWLKYVWSSMDYASRDLRLRWLMITASSRRSTSRKGSFKRHLWFAGPAFCNSMSESTPSWPAHTWIYSTIFLAQFGIHLSPATTNSSETTLLKSKCYLHLHSPLT